MSIDRRERSALAAPASALVFQRLRTLAADPPMPTTVTPEMVGKPNGLPA